MDMNYFSGIINKIWPKKIRSQLILGIVIVHLVLMGIFVYEMTIRQKTFLKGQHLEQTISMVSEYSLNSKSYIIAHDLDGLERLTLAQKNFPTLKYAMVLSPENEVLTHTTTNYIGTKPNDEISLGLKNIPQTQVLLENNSILDIASPVLQDNKIIGWTRVGIGQEYIRENLFGIVRNGIVYTLIALVIGFVVAISVGNRLNKGLYALIDTTDKIKEGDRKLRVSTFQTFEISKLGTAFNQMLDEISANERLLAMVLENLPVGVFVLNETGEIRSANAASKEIWNDIRYVGLEKYGEYKAWFLQTKKRVKPDEWGAAIALKTGTPVLNQEVEIECFDGSMKTILNSAIPLKDDNEKVIGVIAINVEITQRRKAEQEILQMNHAIGERIKELNCLYKISELANTADKSIEEILQQCVNLIPPSYQYPDITQARIIFGKKAYTSPDLNVSQWKQEAKISAGNSKIGSVEVFYSQKMPEMDEGPFLKEERFLINSIADILGNAVENKRKELELRSSEEKFRTLVEQNLVGVFILQDENFQYVNPGLEQISGYTKAELETNIKFHSLIHHDDVLRVRTNYLRRLRGEEVDSQYMFRIFNRTGEMRYVNAIVSQITFYGQPAILGTIIDITDRVEEEKRIGKAVNNAQEKERMQIGMELHDNVQQILVGSLINLDFAKRRLDNKTVIENTLTNVSVYVNDALQELRRLSHELAPSLNHPGSFTDKLNHLISTINKTDAVQFIVDTGKEEVALADDVQVALYRIVQEQLNNVFKYARAKHVWITIRQQNGSLQLTVKDDGIGFDDTTVKRGIGLENIARRTHVLGGSSKIVSAPGNGCELTVEIPL
jgi:PAS domain S-box-containing protein